MQPIRQLPAVTERVETGPIQFGDDWPGLFIRGDNAAAYAMYLELFLDDPENNKLYGMMLKGLLSDLSSCNLVLRKEEKEEQKEQKS